MEKAGETRGFQATLSRLAETARISEEQEQARQAEQKLKERSARIKERISQIPRRYRDATFDKFEILTDQHQVLVDYLKAGNSCIIFGPNGTGKTHLAFATIRHQIEYDKTGIYMLAADLFDQVKALFGDKTAGDLSELERCDYLVIDEVDKRYGSQTEFIALYRLVNKRYNEMLPTMLITNSSRDELVDVVGPSVVDRIREEGKTFNLSGWENYRMRKREVVA
jgi:DNA replication protein DnaC